MISRYNVLAILLAKWITGKIIQTKVQSMNVKDCMKQNVISISKTCTLADAVAVFVEHHIGLLPVVNEVGKLVGVLSLKELISLALPAFIDLIDDFDFVRDFGAVESAHPSKETLSQRVTTQMKPATTVQEDCGLLRAYSVMYDHNLIDLLVVSQDGTLTGIASRVDLGTAILSTWQSG